MFTLAGWKPYDVFAATPFKVIACTSLLLFGCGAPIKRADDVKGMFVSAEDLGTKMANLCGYLHSNSQPPNLNGVDLGIEACQKAGLQAQSLGLSSNLHFSAIRSDGQRFTTSGGGVDRNDQVMRLQTRTELWLNRPLLRLVQTLLPLLKDKGDDLMSQGGNANGLGDGNDMDITLLGKTDLDMEEMKLSLRLELKSSRSQNGAADIHNQFRVDGRLVDNRYAAATIETTQDEVSSKSLIKKGKFVVFIVPHAGDIYIDITTDLYLHSFGVDAIMKDQVLEAIGKGLKMIPELLQKAEAEARGY